MNWIKEIRAFYDKAEQFNLSPSCISLWHALMYQANKTGWISEFSVAVSTLELRSGLQRRTVYNARNTLKQHGFIDFRERSAGQTAMYMIHSQCIFDGTDIAQGLAQGIAQDVAQGIAQDVSPLINNTKPNQTKRDRDNGAPAPCPTAPSLSKQVIGYLNAKLNTKFNPANKANMACINARVKEGHSHDDFITVIDKKVQEWANDPKMMGYLRPQTLFGSKFEAYLNQPWGAGTRLSTTDQAILSRMADRQNAGWGQDDCPALINTNMIEGGNDEW